MTSDTPLSPNSLPPTDEAVAQSFAILRAEMNEIVSQTHELTMHHATTLIELGALRQVLVDAHQHALAHAVSGSEGCRNLLPILEKGWDELRKQREQLAPSLQLDDHAAPEETSDRTCDSQ